MSSNDTTGRVAVITGASSGIGAATGRALAADGCCVALLARRTGRIQALADELGNGALAISADVTDRDSLVAAAQRVKDELGGADVLVNNAGIMLLGPFTSEQREDSRRMVETNLLGAMTATEVFLDQLKDGGGDLVNISSVAGRTARAGNAGYAATKWGMNGWSRHCARSCSPTCASSSSSPARWRPSCRSTSRMARPGRWSSRDTPSCRSLPGTSPRSSRSRSRGRRACR
jgi:NADP-dependent 3-hydroxy acid dehydrogenase YdfG